MAESALFKSYRATEKQKAESALDEALGRLEAQPEQPESPAAQPAQPQQPAKPEAEERAPGVFESLKRGVKAVPKRFMEGIDKIGGVFQPNTPEERGERPAGVLPRDADVSGSTSDVLRGMPQDSRVQEILRNPATRTILGALDALFPFAAFAGETGGDVTEWLEKQTGSLTDESLQQALATLKGSDQNDEAIKQSVGNIEALLQIPYDERVQQHRMIGSIASEVLTGFIPGYTAVVGGARALAGGAKAAAKGAAKAAPSPRMLTAGKAPRSGGALVMPGQAGPRSLEQQVVEQMTKPAHRMTMNDIVERALEERRAMERQASVDLGQPGTNEGREALREEFRTPLDANDSAVANEIIDATRKNGGATYSVQAGMHPGDRGFAVSPYPERGMKVRGDVREADIVDFVSKNEDVLTRPNHYLGTWRDEMGVTHVDVSVVVDDLDTAMKLGRQFDQLAIYDFKNGKSIDVVEAAAAAPSPGAAVDEAALEADPNMRNALAPRGEADSAAAAMPGKAMSEQQSREALDQVRRNEQALGQETVEMKLGGAERLAPEFDPAAWAREKGVVYQGKWGDAELHEFREDALTGGGNFSVEGVPTRESLDAALAQHYETFGVKPQGEVADPLVQRAAEARERLKQNLTDLLGNEAGVLRGEITPALTKQVFNDLVVVGAEIMWSGARSFRRWAEQMIAEFGEAVRGHLKALYPEAQKHVAGMADKFPELPSVREALKLYKEGKFGQDWYENIAEELTRKYGPENGRLYWNLIAATSPNTEVQANISLAERAFKMILSGERNSENLFRVGKREEGFDGFMQAHADNLNRVLRGLDVEGPKAGPFARAPYDPNAVVVDTWMFRAFGLVNEQGDALDSLKNLQFIQQAVTDIAKQVGVSPRQAQAAIWVAQKLRTEGADTLVKPFMEMMELVAKKKAAKIGKLAGETGSANMVGLLALARATIGAAAGAAAGENPEQAAFYALLGAGAGSVLSRKLAQGVWTNLKDTDLLRALKDEAGAINPNSPAAKLRAERRAAREPMPNTQRMDASREVKQSARAINDRLSEMRRLLRDTTLTHDETLSRAANSKFRSIDELLAHEKGTTFTRPEDGVAARDTRDLVIEDLLMQAARAKATGDPADMAKLREQAKLAGLVSERVTDASTVRAQAQEAQKIPSRAARAKTVDYNAVAKELQEFQSGLDEALVNDKDLVNALLEMGERAKAAKLLEDAKKVPSAFWKIYYGLNLLSTPLFHPKNLIGNTGALSLSIGARMVGEIISYPFQVAGVRKIGSKTLIAPGETYDLVVGAFESVKDAWTAGKNVWQGGESLFASNKFGDRMDLLATQRAIQQPGGAFKVMVDGMARVAAANLRFAGSTDEFYKVLSFAGEQRALARRKAWTSGAATWKEAIEEQARLLRETPQDIIRAAESFAEYNTFTKAFDQEPGKLMSALGAKRSLMATMEDLASHPAARLTIAPFFRTPMRIAEFGTEFTPVLNLLAPKIWSDAMSGGANAQLAAAKIAMSAGMTYVLAQYAVAGLITGDWSKDPGLRNRQKEAGFKPWSVYVPPLDKYISYAGLGPIVAPIAAAAQYAQMAPHLKDQGIDTQFMAMTLATMETNLAMPYFDALNDFVQIFEGYDDDAKISSGIKYISDRLRTFVPAAGIMRSVATMLDGEVKDLKEFGATISPAYRDVFNLFSSTMVNLPGLSRLVPAYQNIVTGEPIPLEGGPLPGLISTPTDDSVQVEILELGGAGLPKEIPRYIGGEKMPEGTFRVYGPKAGQVSALSHEQRKRLGTLLTKDVKLDGKNLHAALKAMITGPSDEHDEYKDQSDGARGGKALMIHDLWNSFLDEAEGRLLEEDKGLQETIRRAQAARDRLRVPPGQLNDFDSMVEEAVR